VGIGQGKESGRCSITQACINMMMATINKTMIIPKFNKLEKSWVSSITMKLLINAMIQSSIEQWLN